MISRLHQLAVLSLALSLCSACHTPPRPGTFEPRRGDEIVVAGQFVHTGTPVVLWMDPGGYDAYRVERRFSAFDKSDWDSSRLAETNLTRPNRYNLRKEALTPAEIERVRGGSWDLPLLQRVVDQFVIHYDVAGTSRQCFKVLQDQRDLSVHFLLDLDGTIYQTLDLKERALHVGASNTRSVGVEIANVGAYPPGQSNALAEWYQRTNGQTVLTIPKRFGDGGLRTRGFAGRPARDEIVRGKIHGEELEQYDFTPQQYEALTKLTATLCKVFPKIECKFPADASGKPLYGKLSDADLASYHGVLGHYHSTTEKVDPGPAFDWERVIRGARIILNNGLTPEVAATLVGRQGKQPGE
jgi:N-acetyl-anhydromuramyl-L-alanine amidase AmpD